MKKQMRFEKTICFTVLIACSISFVLALGIMTDVYNLKLAEDYMDTGKLFDLMQPFNSNLVKLSILMIIVAIFLFITKTNNRRRYYITNYIASILVIITNLAITTWAIININKFKVLFKNIDYVQWSAIHEIFSGIRYTESTLWFDINIAAAVLVIVSTLLLAVNLIWKITLMKEEDKLLSSQIYLKEKEEAQNA